MNCCVRYMLFLTLALTACSAHRSGSNDLAEQIARAKQSSSATRRHRDFNVQVSTQGQEVQNPYQKLVHHVAIPDRIMTELLAEWPRSVDRRFQVAAEIGREGAPVGIRVVSQTGIYDEGMLGLMLGDLITATGSTATGRASPQSLEDLHTLLVGLERGETSVSLTCMRNGTPHKIYYHLAQ